MRPFLVLACLMAMPCRVVCSQTPDLEHVVDSLRERITSWDSTTAHYDSIARAGVDTIRIGGFSAITNGSVRGIVQDGLAELRERLIDIMGSDTALFRNKPFAVFADRRISNPGDRSISIPSEDMILAGLLGRDVVNQFQDAAQRYLALQTGRQFQSWIGPRVPIADSIVGLHNIYTTAVLSPLSVVQRCYTGDLDGCRRSLALEAPEHPQDALRAWFDPEDRHLLVEQLGLEWNYETNSYDDPSPERGRCLESRSDADCLIVLASRYRAGIDAESYARGTNFHPFLPLESGTHSTLLAVALDVGGDGAYSRLLASDAADPGVRLQDAAGVPLDSILSAWRERVLNAAPPSVEVQPKSAWVTLFWVLAAACLAVGSSRWR